MTADNVVWVDFQSRRQNDGREWLRLMAERCEAQAAKAEPRTAARLKQCADAYWAKAKEPRHG